MSVPKLGRLVRVELREVWKHEAQNFTQWLVEAENLDLLSDAIGIELADAHAEVGVGSYRVDVLARDSITGGAVVIENQMESTDHKHLGQLITYAAGHEAQTAVWIAKKATDEHKSALEWLNDHTGQDVSFFLVEAQAWRIGDSDPAPVFEVIARPNDWVRAQKQASSEMALDYDPEIQEFYERVRAYGMVNAKNISRWRAASARRWYDISIGSSQAHLALRVTKRDNRVSVELYINDNKDLFNLIHDERESIELALGMSLEWHELPNKKASRIVAVAEGSFNDPLAAEELVVWLVDTADRFARTFSKYL